MSVKNRDKILEELFARATLGIKFGLDRILQAITCIGNPHNEFTCLHVAGTNGKGSVCAYLESILRCNGFTTGLFTSPHIINFEERFLINGKPVTSDEWLDVYQSIRYVIDRFSLTFFEISALIAFELFKRNKVEWAVIETGLGGRLDATNIVRPEVSVITCIDIDHIEYLGSSISDIANEKLGIVKQGIPLVLGIQQDQSIAPLAQKVCNERSSLIKILVKEDAKAIKQLNSGSTFMYNSTEFFVPLQGLHQVMNALCALEVAEIIGIDRKNILFDGIKKTFFPGRFQEVSIRGKSIILDVAHNPQAGKCLCQLLKSRFPQKPICFIVGIMSDKNIQHIIIEFVTCANRIIITHPKTSRAADPKNIFEKIPQHFRGQSLIIPSVKEAVYDAIEKFNGVICITGSFYTVSEAMTALNIDPYKNTK